RDVVANEDCGRRHGDRDLSAAVVRLRKDHRFPIHAPPPTAARRDAGYLPGEHRLQVRELRTDGPCARCAVSGSYSMGLRMLGLLVGFLVVIRLFKMTGRGGSWWGL